MLSMLQTRHVGRPALAPMRFSRCCSLAVLGAAIAPGGLRRRRGRGTRVVAATLLAAASLALLWPQLVRRPALDVHPTVPAVAQLAGTWSDGPDTLELRADGAYACRGARCTGFGSRGTWTRESDGSVVARWSDGHTVPWSVVTISTATTYLARTDCPANGDSVSWEGRSCMCRRERSLRIGHQGR